MPPTSESGPAPTLHPPKQERSRQTLERIAEAGLALMAEVGPEKAAVAEIVKRAGASVGSFYARFGSKDDLIRFLQNRVWAKAGERWDSALGKEDWSALSMGSVVEGVVGLLVHTLRADYRSRRVLGAHPGVAVREQGLGAEFHRHVLDGVKPLLMNRRDEISHPDPEAAVQWGYRFATGAIREFLDSEEGQGEPAVPHHALAAEVARAWTAYLTVGSEDAATAAEGEVDFFDPWG